MSSVSICKFAEGSLCNRFKAFFSKFWQVSKPNQATELKWQKKTVLKFNVVILLSVMSAVLQTLRNMTFLATKTGLLQIIVFMIYAFKESRKRHKGSHVGNPVATKLGKAFYRGAKLAESLFLSVCTSFILCFLPSAYLLTRAFFNNKR